MENHIVAKVTCRIVWKRLISVRFLAVLSVQFFTLLYYLAPVKRLAASSGDLISPFAFPLVTSGSFYILLWITGSIVMFCDIPSFLDDASPGIGGNARFIASIGYVVLFSALYITLTIVLSVLCCLPYASLAGEWGQVWKNLALGQSSISRTLSFEVSPMILSEQYGWATMGKAIALVCGCSCFIGAICYLGNLISKRRAGPLFAVFVCLLDVTLYNLISFKWLKYSPVTLAQWGFYWYGIGTTGISITYGYAFLWGGSFLLYAICFLFEKVYCHPKKQKQEHASMEVLL